MWNFNQPDVGSVLFLCIVQCLALLNFNVPIFVGSPSRAQLKTIMFLSAHFTSHHVVAKTFENESIPAISLYLLFKLDTNTLCDYKLLLLCFPTQISYYYYISYCQLLLSLLNQNFDFQKRKEHFPKLVQYVSTQCMFVFPLI